jgi:hypothetical protein
MARDTFSRSLHDLGLAAWFGGTLANAVALNPAASEAGGPSSTGRVANVGWNRWTPVNAAAISVHLIGSVGLLNANRGRIVAQQGVASMTLVKTALTAAALGVTAYSRVLGKKLAKETDVPAVSATEPSTGTPPEVAKAQKQLAVLQWAVPTLTGAILAVNAFAGEQQRASEVQKGLVARLTGWLTAAT